MSKPYQAAMYFIVDFDGEDVWADLDFWTAQEFNGHVDYEFQQVWFKVDLS